MAKSKADPAAPEVSTDAHGYFAWSRDPAVGLFAVLPLWLAYESSRLWISPSERNLSEWFLLETVQRLGPGLATALRIAFGLLVFVAMRSVIRREIPWARVTLVVVLEGIVYGLMLGPLAGALADPAVRMLSASNLDPRLFSNLVGSLGAGIFEELVFRLGLMSVLVWVWLRASGSHAGLRALGGVFAVVVSAVLFSLHHHLREDWDSGVFVFRAMAGVLLGFLFWFRGFGVCVYTHAMYDVYYFMTHVPR